MVASVGPSYLVAADNHDLLNSTPESWTDSILNVPKTVALGVGAGITEVLNVPITIGNWFGAEFDRVDYKAELQSYDDDLAKYYTDHKLGVDTIGFVLGTLVPGMAGVKVLKAGQGALRLATSEGVFGENLGSALGLLAPNQPKALAAAISEIRSTGNVFSLTETNTLRALAAGAGQAALESAAYETMVAATMYQSPVLNELSVSDLAWNAAIGTALGAGIGGVFTGIGVASKIKKAASAAELELLPYSIREVPAPSAIPSDKILFRLNQISSMPELPTTGDLVERAGRTSKATIDKLWLDIRADFGEFTRGDRSLAEALYQTARLNPLDRNLGNLLDSTVAGRVNITTGVEAELNKIRKIVDKNGGSMVGLTDEQLQAFADNRVSFVKMLGEDAGTVVSERPAVLSLTDTLPDGSKIELVKGGIKIGRKTYTQDNNPYMPFNIFGASHYNVEARYMWAERLGKWVDDPAAEPHMVHANDIPLLEKAYRDGLDRLKVIPENGDIAAATKLGTRDEIYEFLVAQKQSIAQRLAKAEPKNISIPEFIDKFKNYFGINFNIVDEAGSDYLGFFQRIMGKSGNNVVGADVIALDKMQTLTQPLARMMRTLKHEEGHRTYQALLDAQGITAGNLANRMPKLMEDLKKIGSIVRKNYYASNPEKLSVARLEHEYFADAFYYLSRNPDKMNSYPELKRAIGHLVKPIPQEVIDSVAKRIAKVSPEEIAKIVNAESKWLDGSARRPGGEFARNKAKEEYIERAIKSGARPSEIPANPLDLPTYAKVVSQNRHMKDLTENEIQGMAKVSQAVKLYDESARRVATGILGETLPVIPDKEFLVGAKAGPGFISFENSNYGKLGSVLAYVGQRTHNLIRKQKEISSAAFTAPLQKLATNLDDAVEFSVLNEKLRNLPNKYTLETDAETGIRKFVYDGSEAEIADAISRGIPVELPIKSPAVADLIEMHIQRNSDRVANRKQIRANEGLPDNLRGDVFYPIPRSPKDTPFFAFVIDDTITSTGHSKMIYAADEKGLEKLKQEILEKMPEFKVLTKAESEAYFKAHGQFDFERSINDNYINTQMARRGVSASYLPLTDPSRIAQSFLEWHLERDANMVREAVSHNYSRQFESLRQAAGESLNIASSKAGYAGTLKAIESTVDNPATNLIKMALDIQKTAEYPYWSSVNKMLDEQLSSVFAKVGAVLTDATSPQHLEDVSNALRKAGYEGITNITEGVYNAMNAKVPRGALTSFINKANGLIATFALRLDPMNAMNNLIGSQVLLGTEVNAVVKAIQAGNADAAGELAQLMKISVPGGKGSITSPTKLIANAITNYHGRKDLRDFYKRNGFITSITDQYDQTLDTLAVSASDNVGSLNKKIGDALTTARKFGDKGETLTANRFAEEMNRFVAADVMRQITDVAVKAGVMKPTEALTYINTFVNRTQGNFLASQRPMMFQGPIGQAIGLFQTYQFNLIQQMMRHIGDGQIKNAATMMGLQGTIYGMNGLPGFNAFNTHIIGSAPGNTDNKDLYRAAYNGVGKEAGDWLMYGLGSNWMSIFSSDLKNNLYSRGDINPRNLTIIPTDLASIPVVQATSKLVSNAYESMSKMQAGGDVWGTFLRAIEQNGVSRPLAGMAQVINGMTSPSGKVTTLNSKGNIVMSHDWMNLASGVRVLGAKPLDEAMVNDAMFRFNSYKAADSKKKSILGEAIKVSILSGDAPDSEQMKEFAEYYAKIGGNQQDFAKFYMGAYKNATTSQANQLRDKLSNPYSQSLQELLGGYKLEDLSRPMQQPQGE